MPSLATGGPGAREERGPAMNGAPVASPRPGPGRPVHQATRLHLGRILVLVLVVGAALATGTAWLLWTKARPVAQAVESTVWPAWMRQPTTYHAAALPPPKQA